MSKVKRFLHSTIIVAMVGSLVALMVPTQEAAAQDDSNCTVNVKLQEFRVWADMGDGFLDGQMEVQAVFSVGHEQLYIDRYYPAEGNEKMRRGDSRRLEDYIFSVPAREAVFIEMLIVEIDDLPRIFGVDVGMVLGGLGTLVGELGGVGEFFDGLIQSGVQALRDSFAEDSIIADDIITLYADDWWNAGETRTYTSVNGNFELTYRVSVSGCERSDEVSVPVFDAVAAFPESH